MTDDDLRELRRLLVDGPRVESLLLAVSTLLDVVKADRDKWSRLRMLGVRSEFLSLCLTDLLDASEVSAEEVLTRYNDMCHLGDS